MRKSCGLEGARTHRALLVHRAPGSHRVSSVDSGHGCVVPPRRSSTTSSSSRLALTKIVSRIPGANLGLRVLGCAAFWLAACEGESPQGTGAAEATRNGAARAAAAGGAIGAGAADATASDAASATAAGTSPGDASGGDANGGAGGTTQDGAAVLDTAKASVNGGGVGGDAGRSAADAGSGSDGGAALGGPGATCLAAAACGPGLTCKRDGCAAPGWCVPIPGGCPAVAYPVCGCDGATYPSPCALLALGIGKKHDGPCAGTACNGGDSSCGPLAWCAAPCGGVGTCKAKPAVCGKDIAPVCGCNGKDYLNACSAAQQGISVAKDGSCAPSSPCQPGTNDAACLCKVGGDAACGAGAFCSAAKLGGCGGVGLCWPKPATCPDLAKPVCGCDGATYGNACAASAAGVNVASEGPCKGDKVCKMGTSPCPVGAFCKAVGDFQCGGAGTCAPLPQMCQTLLLPVCGCDGKTYPNACSAAAVGINVAAKGECGGGATGAPCKSAASCPAGQGCKNGACQSCKNVACPAVACPDGKQVDPCTCQCFAGTP